MKTAEAFRHVRLVHPEAYAELIATERWEDDWVEFEEGGLVSPRIYEDLLGAIRGCCTHVPETPDATIDATRRLTGAIRDQDWLALGGDPEVLHELRDGLAWPHNQLSIRRLAAAADLPAPVVCEQLLGVRVGAGASESPVAARSLVVTAAVHRNDPCPCGSGRRFKRCCRSSRREVESQDLRSVTRLSDEQAINTEVAEVSAQHRNAPEATSSLVTSEQLHLFENQDDPDVTSEPVPDSTLVAVRGGDLARGLRELGNPIVLAGIELLRADLRPAPSDSPTATARQIKFSDNWRRGVRLREIGRSAGVSGEAVRQAIAQLTDKALHPVLASHALRFWEIWHTGPAALQDGAPLTRADVGSALSCLRGHSSSTGWSTLEARHPALFQALQERPRGTTEPFVAAAGSGRHVLDVQALKGWLTVLVRHGILYESQVLALPEGHPAFHARRDLEATTTSQWAGASQASTETIPIRLLNLSTRSYNVLTRRGVLTAEEVSEMSPADVLALPQAGPGTVKDIEAALANVGLSLRRQPTRAPDATTTEH